MVVFDLRTAFCLACVGHLFFIMLFMSGMFPLNVVSNTYSTLDDLPSEPVSSRSVVRLNKSDLYLPVVGQVVLILVDSMRADFIFDQQYVDDMPYLQSLLQDKRGISFVARVHPPTATMPRIKALVSGTIPNFIDIVQNFGSPSYTEDNIILQATKHKIRTVFYGDNTWLRMFPNSFKRSEGTTSFFVADFYEVDKNVSRHLESEMKINDWDFLILHYLGLDHIGHVLGPSNHLIRLKLKEMDDVIQQLHVALMEKNKTSLPFMIAICSDHGMDNTGGHGGASFQETRVPLIFISSAFEGVQVNIIDEVFQIDFAPTMSVLLGLPIPKNNLGKVLSPLTSNLSWRRRIYLAQVNAEQLQQVASNYVSKDNGECFEKLKEAKQKHNIWLSDESQSLNPSSVFSNYQRVTSCFRDLVSSRVVKFDIFQMLISVFCQVLIACFVSLTIVANLTRYKKNLHISSSISKLFFVFVFLTLLGFFCDFAKICGNSFLCSLSWQSIPVILITLILMSLFLLMLMIICLEVEFFNFFQHIVVLDFSSLFLCFGLLIHTVTFASSSFIEEEHQTWYFLCLTALFVDAVNVCRRKTTAIYNVHRKLLRLLLIATIFRVSRSWNSTGDKWVHLEDSGDWLNRSENKVWLSVAVVAGLSLVVLLRSTRQHLMVTLLLILCCLTTYVYHCAAGEVLFPFKLTKSRMTHYAQVNYLLIVLIPVVALLLRANRREVFEATITSFSALSVLLLRPHNILLVAFWTAMKELYSKHLKESKFSPEICSFIFIWMAQASYFLQGNSNSIAKVDFRSGYVGITEYNPLLVGFLLICATFAGPIFWILSLLSFQSENFSLNNGIPRCLLVLLLHRILPWAFYSIIVFIQRHHLFIWTVFSPKLLFEGTLSILYSVICLTTLLVTRCSQHK